MTMTDGELGLLDVEMGRCVRYLEFGCGASTLAAARRANIERMEVVESSREYLEEHVQSDAVVREAMAAGRAVFHVMEFGPCGSWGRPADARCRWLWPAYALTPFATRRDYDLVLVDGIFRVACACAAMLAVPEARVLIHDFWIRKRYHAILRYTDVTERCDTMVVLRAKSDTHSQAGLRKLLMRRMWWPDDERLHRRLQARWRWMRGQ